MSTARIQSIHSAMDAKVKARLINGKYLDWRRLLDVVAELLADGTINSGDINAVVTYAEELFEQYVRPYDIPGIGPIIEARVDDILKGMIRPAITAMFDMIDAKPSDDSPSVSV